MKKNIFFIVAVIGIVSLFFIGWRKTDEEVLRDKLVESPTYLEYTKLTLAYCDELKQERERNIGTIRKHKAIEYQRVLASNNLTAIEKKDSVAKLGLVTNDKMDMILWETNKIILKVRDEFPELSKLTPDNRRKVEKSAFIIQAKRLNAESH
jgi:hypothetical protein